MDTKKLFREKLREFVLSRYPSLDRFYLETDFGKGHLSLILRGKTSPSVDTLVRLADLLEVEVKDFFVFPRETVKHKAIALLSSCQDEKLVERIWKMLEAEAGVKGKKGDGKER